MDVNKVFVQPKDLFVRTLLDIQENKIAEIHATTPAVAFSLARQEKNWKVTVNGTTSDGADEACTDLAEAVCDLQASDILFGQKELQEPADSVLRVKMSEGGAEHVLTFGPEKEGKRSVKVSGQGQVFVVAQSDVAKLFPSVDTLKKAEAPPPPPPVVVTPTQPIPPAPATPPATQPIPPATPAPPPAAPTPIAAPAPAPPTPASAPPPPPPPSPEPAPPNEPEK
jgi:hypothetical protein